MPALILLSALLACSTPTTDGADVPVASPPTTGPLAVVTTSFPAHYLVEQLGGEHVTATNLLPAGEDAPFWHPTNAQVAEAAQAPLIVTNGAGFEGWLATATLPEDRVVDSSEGIPLVVLEAQTHSHGKGGEHSHAGTDPHTWSDPLTYADQARNVHRALTAAIPSQVPDLERKLSKLDRALSGLHKDFEQALAPAKGVPLAANHPAFNYLARRYALEVTSFDFDPEEVPSEASLAAFADWAGAQPAPILLWESAPAEAVKAAFPASTRHVVIDPLEQPGAAGSYDYQSQARGNLATFKELFGAK